MDGCAVEGIDFNGKIVFKDSSLREFYKGEYHVTRFCKDDVLLLVYEGTLRFTENGVPVEVGKGEYYIQRANMYQSAKRASDMPKYLYVHFSGEWKEGENVLPVRGNFDIGKMRDIIKEMNDVSYAEATYTERLLTFLRLLIMLRLPFGTREQDKAVSKYIEENFLTITSLEDICRRFNYSKNHIINILKAECEMTPFEYINELKIKRAKYLMRATSKTLDEISLECGFNSYSHFYRSFFKRNSLSPAKWREKMQFDPLWE